MFSPRDSWCDYYKSHSLLGQVGALGCGVSWGSLGHVTNGAEVYSEVKGSTRDPERAMCGPCDSSWPWTFRTVSGDPGAWPCWSCWTRAQDVWLLLFLFPLKKLYVKNKSGASLVVQWLRICLPGASLVAQWLRICLPMQGTRVQALVWEDPTCRRATRPVSHNYWACACGACAPQQERPR